MRNFEKAANSLGSPGANSEIAERRSEVSPYVCDAAKCRSLRYFALLIEAKNFRIRKFSPDGIDDPREPIDIYPGSEAPH